MHTRNRIRAVVAMAMALLMLVPSAALAAVEFVQSGTGRTGSGESGNAAGSLPIDKPDGLAVGDFMLAQVTFETGRTAGTDSQITPPGWTLVRRTNAPDGNSTTSAGAGTGTDLGQAIFYRFATASDVSASTFSFPFATNQRAAGAMLRYTGVHKDDPIVASSGRGGANGNLVAPGVHAEANSMVVAFLGLKKSGTGTLPAPAGMTERVLYQQKQDVKIRAADQKWGATEGNTGDKTSSPSVQEKWVAQLVTLREAAPTQTSNNAPVYTPAATQTAIAGVEQAINLGSFADPDAHDAWDVTVNWGDGTPQEFITVTAPGSLGSRSHTYATDGEKTVTVQVSDRVTSHQGSFKVNVSPPPKQDQTITFDEPSTPQAYADFFAVAPTASSDLPVSVAASGACSISGSTVTMTSGTGTCTLTASQAGNADFNAAPNVVRTLAAERRAITVTADAKSKVFGAADPALTYQVASGSLVGSDSLTGALIRDLGSAVGTYAIQQGTLSASSNYNLTFVGADFTINKASATINITDLAKTYNGSAQGATVTTTPSGLAVTVTYNDSATVPTNAGMYQVVATVNDANYAGSATGSLVIDRREVTGSFTADNKEYDGGTSATILARSLDGVVGNDEVSHTGGSASFADKNVGVNKVVTLTGASLTGSAAGNYRLTGVNPATADITKKALTGSFTADNKEYDGTRAATVSGTSLPGVLEGDTVTLAVSNAQFDTKDVGTNKDVTASLSLSGADEGNYTVNASHTAKANITAKAVTGSFAAANKVYDGGTSATVMTRSLAGVLDNEIVSLSGGTASFNNKTVGTGKTVSLRGATLDGVDAGNYTLTSVSTTTANITPRGLTVSATGVNKEYDGNTTATVTLSTDEIDGDDVTAVYTNASFADKNVGANKPVSVSGIRISGDDASNYNLTNTTVTTAANITPRAITVTADAQTKVYGDDDPALTYKVIPGTVLEGDTFTGRLSRLPGEDVGTSAITQGSLSLGANYNVTFVGAILTITARPITVTADAKSKVFGAADPAFTWALTSGNLVGSDQITGSLSRNGVGTTAGEAVGSHPILVGTLTAGSNYDLTFSGANLAITAWDAQGHGFYQPVGVANSIFVASGGALPTATSTTVWNVAKGGSTIPLKFNVYAGSVEKTSTSDIKGFTVTGQGCPGNGAVSDDVDFVTTGNTSLRYDTTDKQFIQNWATPKVSSDTCYRATVTFADGSSLSAFFRLRK
jgi:hypothetical protein